MKKYKRIQIYDEIKNRIRNCYYLPGAVLNEEMLTEEFDSSKTPVRDALGRLEQENLLTVIPKVGIEVNNITVKDINDIYEVRLLIEPYALLNYGKTIDPSTFLNYYDLFKLQNSKNNLDDHIYSIDDDFHLLIVQSCENEHIIDTYERISFQTQRLRILSGKNTEKRLAQSYSEHLEIIEACLSSDLEQASKLLIRHIKNSQIEAYKTFNNINKPPVLLESSSNI